MATLCSCLKWMAVISFASVVGATVGFAQDAPQQPPTRCRGPVAPARRTAEGARRPGAADRRVEDAARCHRQAGRRQPAAPQRTGAEDDHDTTGTGAPQRDRGIDAKAPRALAKRDVAVRRVSKIHTDSWNRRGDTDRRPGPHPAGAQPRSARNRGPVRDILHPDCGNAEAGKESRTTLLGQPEPIRSPISERRRRPSAPRIVEGDFAGDNRTHRLRHAFGQWRSVLIGQTWSMFSDPEAEPDGLDSKASTPSRFRQRRSVDESRAGAHGAFTRDRNPSPDITGASDVNQIPDFIARGPVQRRRHDENRGSFERADTCRWRRPFVSIRGEPDQATNQIVSTGAFGGT